jgi:hypothetical protein
VTAAWGDPVGPAWTEIVAALTSAATLVFVIAGLVFAKRQLDATKSSRHADLLAELSRRWDELLAERQESNSYDQPEDLAKAIENLYSANDMKYYTLARVPSFFEDLAVQVVERNIPIELVAKSFKDAVIYHWSRWKPATAFLRQDQPSVYEHFEDLAKKLEGVKTR